MCTVRCALGRDEVQLALVQHIASQRSEWKVIQLHSNLQQPTHHIRRHITPRPVHLFLRHLTPHQCPAHYSATAQALAWPHRSELVACGRSGKGAGIVGSACRCVIRAGIADSHVVGTPAARRSMQSRRRVCAWTSVDAARAARGVSDTCGSHTTSCRATPTT